MNLLNSQSRPQNRPNAFAGDAFAVKPAPLAGNVSDSHAVPRGAGQRLAIQFDLCTVDVSTGEPLALFDSIAGAIPKEWIRHIKGDENGCRITITSSSHASLRRVRDELHGVIGSLHRSLRPYRATLLWSGLHPCSDPCEALVVPAAAQADHRRRQAQSAPHWEPCGVKFRVELAKGEVSRTLCHLKGFAPLLVALSANSPFLRNQLTDRRSQRVLIRSAVSVAELITPRCVSGSAADDRATIEIGCCDVPQNLDRVIALAAIVQALVASGGRGGHLAAPTDEFVRAELYEAAKHGLDARLTDGNGRLVSPLQLLDDLVQGDLETVAIELGIDAALRLAPAVLAKSGSNEFASRPGSSGANWASSAARPERGRGTSLATLATAASLLLAGGLFAAQAALG